MDINYAGFCPPTTRPDRQRWELCALFRSGLWARFLLISDRSCCIAARSRQYEVWISRGFGRKTAKIGNFGRFSRISQAYPHATISVTLTFCVAAQHFFPIVGLGAFDGVKRLSLAILPGGPVKRGVEAICNLVDPLAGIGAEPFGRPARTSGARARRCASSKNDQPCCAVIRKVARGERVRRRQFRRRHPTGGRGR